MNMVELHGAAWPVIRLNAGQKVHQSNKHWTELFFTAYHYFGHVFVPDALPAWYKLSKMYLEW